MKLTPFRLAANLLSTDSQEYNTPLISRNGTQFNLLHTALNGPARRPNRNRSFPLNYIVTCVRHTELISSDLGRHQPKGHALLRRQPHFLG